MKKFVMFVLATLLMVGSASAGVSKVALHAQQVDPAAYSKSGGGWDPSGYNYYQGNNGFEHEANLYSCDYEINPECYWDNVYWVYLVVIPDWDRGHVAISLSVWFQGDMYEHAYDLSNRIPNSICSTITGYCETAWYFWDNAEPTSEPYDPWTQDPSDVSHYSYWITPNTNAPTDNVDSPYTRREPIIMGTFYTMAYSPSRVVLDKNRASSFGISYPNAPWFWYASDNTVVVPDTSDAYVNFGMQTSVQPTTWGRIKAQFR